MICENKHPIEVMITTVTPKGLIHKCPRCGMKVKPSFNPYQFDLRDWAGQSCYNCMNLDDSESALRYTGEYIPGRCLHKGYRILESEIPEDGTCEGFEFRRKMMFDQIQKKHEDGGAKHE